MLAKKHRVLAGIASYYVITTAFSMVSGFIQTILQFTTLASGSFEPALLGIMISSLVLTIVQLIVCYIGTKWILTKKLNLD
jgi:hypothetical protein